MPKLKNPSVKQLKRKLDKLMSEYVRRKDADDNGFVACITCGKKEHWKDMDAGHYVSRRHHSLRFDERNLWPQCRGENRFRGGALDEYALALIRKYGEGILQELNREKRKIKKWTKKELQDLISMYSEKLKTEG